MMKSYIKKCGICGQYTLEDMHCNEKTASVGALKFSPQDKYAKYRRKIKEIE